VPSYRIMIAGFPYGGQTSHHGMEWLARTYAKMRDDPRIGAGNVMLWQLADTPITMGRNRALTVAEENNIDYVLMFDSDMRFDLPYPDAKPFWDTAWEFMLSHQGPAVIAAPYCGPPPQELVYVFRWNNTQSDDPNPNMKLEMISRGEAASLTGIERVAALPTGLILIDMKALKDLPHPRFYYEFTDETQSHKASTEDVAFCRDLTYLDIPLYVAWDCWAGHIKAKLVGKPQNLPPDLVPEWVVERAAQLKPGETPRPYGPWKEKPHGEYLRNKWLARKEAWMKHVAEEKGKEEALEKAETYKGLAEAFGKETPEEYLQRLSQMPPDEQRKEWDFPPIRPETSVSATSIPEGLTQSTVDKYFQIRAGEFGHE
jgi:hypothetical protein